jgi:hypothetical protein
VENWGVVVNAAEKHSVDIGEEEGTSRKMRVLKGMGEAAHLGY